MSFHAFHANWLWHDEFVCIFGIAGGRVDYTPAAKYLYSFRIFLGLFKLEILWKTHR